MAGAADGGDQLPVPELAAVADALEGNSVFGRVTPRQKQIFVTALQSRGHTVAMTGDGINDVLALTRADLGVAMGSGSGATRAAAKIVLLDDSFATLPYVVAEGRRVLGNIERVASLFLTKTAYAVLLSVATAVVALALTIPASRTFFELRQHELASDLIGLGIAACAGVLLTLFLALTQRLPGRADSRAGP